MEELVRHGNLCKEIDANLADKLIPLLQQAKTNEGEAIRCIRELLSETIDNRFNEIGLR